MAGQTETVLNAILEGIDRGNLNPGDIIEEGALMAAHAVSRTPVREALIQLETAGLIRRLPRKGAVLFKPTLEEFLSILEVNMRLEGQAAGWPPAACHPATLPISKTPRPPARPTLVISATPNRMPTTS